jgi:predicted permease
MTFLDALRIDSRHSLRRLRHSPALSLTILVTIVIVLAANTTIFSFLNAMVLRKAAVASPDELVAISAADAKTNQPGYFYAETVAAFRAVQQSFAHVSMYNGGGTLRVEPPNGDAFNAGVEAVSVDFFDLMHVHPSAGRFFGAEDDAGPAAVVLSDRLSRRVFSGRQEAVGRTLSIDGKPVLVLGVAPPGFTGLALDGGADLFVSFPTLKILLSSTLPGIRSPNLIARMKDGVSIESARAELSARWPAIQAATIGSLPAAVRTVVDTQRVQLDSAAHGFSGLRRQYGASVLLLMGIAAVMLLIGAVNLSGLLLARSLARSQQYAIQRALGATSARLVQQSILDGMFLSGLGLVVAIPIAWLAVVRVTPLLVARGLPLLQPLTPTSGVLILAVATTAVMGLFIGALPAWRAAVVRPDAALHRGRSVARSLGRAGQGVLVVQVALAMVLVTGASLFAVTLTNLYRNDVQTRTKPILWTRLGLRSGISGPSTESYLRSVVDALSEVPGADGAALSLTYPAFLGFRGVLASSTVSWPGAGGSTITSTGMTEYVTPGFFDVVGIARHRGRDFTWSDNAKAGPVGIINQSLAEKLFGSTDPVGRELTVTSSGVATRVAIVGVVADAAIGRLDAPHVPVVFRPMIQELSRVPVPLAHLRVDGDLAVARDGYVAAVNAQGRHVVRALFTMDAWVDDALLQERLVAGVSASAALIAALLAAIGISGALAYSVAAQVREIGIRMSIGATAQDIVRMVIRQGLSVAIAGVAVGVPLAIGAGRLAQSSLHGIGASDPWLIGGAASCFLITALVAAGLPALRASRILPTEALRQD